MASNDEIMEKNIMQLRSYFSFLNEEGKMQAIRTIMDMLNSARAYAVEDTYVTCDFCDASDVKGYHIKAVDKAELKICQNCFDIPSAVKTKMEDEFKQAERSRIRTLLEKAFTENEKNIYETKGYDGHNHKIVEYESYLKFKKELLSQLDNLSSSKEETLTKEEGKTSLECAECGELIWADRHSKDSHCGIAQAERLDEKE